MALAKLGVGFFAENLRNARANRDERLASPGAVIALTKEMALDSGPYEVRVNRICPRDGERPFDVWRLAEVAFDLHENTGRTTL